MSAPDGHSRANAGRTTAEAVAAVGEIAALAHGAGGSLEVVIATAWDCPFDGRTPITRTVDVARAAVTAGADQLCLGDTIGTTTPLRVVQLLDAVRRACPGVPVGVHFHDTRGTGQANALAAVQAGVTQLDSSIGGLGGCPFAPGASGNIATEELVYMLEESGVRTGLDLDAVLAAARVTEQAVGHELPSSLYRAGGRSVPRGAGRRRMTAPADGPARVVDPRVMRDVLGHFASGVTVVTAVTDDGPIGFTCQSFSSLSLDPPLVVFAPARTSRTWPRLRDIGRFCVNVLAEGQDAVSQNFARSAPDKFAGRALDAQRARLPRARRRRRVDRRRAVGRVRRRRPHARRRPRARPRRRPRPPSAAVPPRGLRPARTAAEAAEPRRGGSAEADGDQRDVVPVVEGAGDRGVAELARGRRRPARRRAARTARAMPWSMSWPGRSISPSV